MQLTKTKGMKDHGSYEGIVIDYGVRILCARGSYRRDRAFADWVSALGFGGKVLPGDGPAIPA